MNNDEYVKTGEDKKFEYYRNDSEVLSDDGEAEAYDEILNKKEELNIKINDKELKIKKRSVDKIMILSDSEPGEQILFSHYKTVEQKKNKDKVKTHSLINENIKTENPNNVQNLKENLSPFPYKSINEPLSEMKSNGDNVAINVNVPKINNDNSDEKENMMCKKTEKASDDLLVVGLPPQAVKLKWFYLLLVLCGIADIIFFIASLVDLGFMFNMFLIMIFGIVGIFTGLFGYKKINNKEYNNNLLFILTIVCAVLPALNVILLLLSEKTRGYIIFGLILNVITIVFAILCIFFTRQLKNQENENKLLQLQKLL